MPDYQGVRAILCDIEGTTTPIDFVHQTLFPYSLERMEAWVTAYQHEPEVAQALAQTTELASELAGQPLNLSLEEQILTLKNWIREDRKATPLKTLQGFIWEGGYRNGDLQTVLYSEVHTQLQVWRQQGIKLAIYSSGSVKAQRLLFGFTQHGDITPLFEAYFDTLVGGKKEKASYENIVAQWHPVPEEILFLSDVADELAAAQAARLQVCQIIRPGTAVDGRFLTASTFEDIRIA
jgi:enolase-phosphatase E1